MSVSVLIEYKDPSRPADCHPFCFNSVLVAHWLPIADKYGLKNLQLLDCLFIKEPAEIEQVIQELRFVENLLNSPDRGEVPERTAEYMLDRIATLIPMFEDVIAEWDAVACLSL